MRRGGHRPGRRSGNPRDPRADDQLVILGDGQAVRLTGQGGGGVTGRNAPVSGVIGDRDKVRPVGADGAIAGVANQDLVAAG
jgi:hypothetical protein